VDEGESHESCEGGNAQQDGAVGQGFQMSDDFGLGSALGGHTLVPSLLRREFGMNPADKIGMTCQHGRPISLLFHVVARSGRITVKLRYLKRFGIAAHNSAGMYAKQGFSFRLCKNISC
jgi:hypothetical protein